jgi:hypothetical protein
MTVSAEKSTRSGTSMTFRAHEGRATKVVK